MIDSLLLTCPIVYTFAGAVALTNATGFFFARDGRLYLVTARHVFFDGRRNHRPDRIEIEVHSSDADVAATLRFSVPLYNQGNSVWLAATDDGGAVDVAIAEIDQAALPASTRLQAFTPDHLLGPGEHVEIGARLLTVGYPMGFEDALHRLPVARQAGLASSFGLRFGGKGYFLVDAWTHRGISGAPVVMRAAGDFNPAGAAASLPWRLLGIHSARLESPLRDPSQDEVLGLNAVWYADVILALTDNRQALPPAGGGH
ncbi:MAG: serine protease [Alphaproteobacteria bacterium]|nr:serine protease [Alphaproteobacteria bacterium]